MKRTVGWGLLLVVVLALLAFHDRVIGGIAQGVLADRLSYLFGLRVQIQGLRIYPFTGRILASKVIFWNPIEFSSSPHLRLDGLEFDLDWGALRNKEVKIKTARLEKPLYYIERIRIDDQNRNNVITWWRHIKAIKNKNQEARKDVPPSLKKEGKKWRIEIGRFLLHEGSFIFEDKTKEPPKRLVFRKINGEYSNFIWPSVSPNFLGQQVKLIGTFGEDKPAPFWIQGMANFPTSQVSFRLDGEVRDGAVKEYDALWEGLSLRPKKGNFDLRLETLCMKKYFTSNNTLILKSLKVKPGPSGTDKIWGVPMTAVVGFLQNEKTIELKIPVHGNISDPKFEFFQAFRAAFEDSLRQKAQGSIRIFVGGTAKIADQTKTVITEAPGKLADGIGKIADMVKPAASEAAEDEVQEASPAVSAVETIPAEPAQGES